MTPDDPGVSHSESVVRFTLNSTPVQVAVEAGETLVDTLHDRLGMTSVRGTCGLGICGTCTTVLDGQVVSACLTLTAQVQDRDVLTSEGLLEGGEVVDRVQQAFLEAEAFQCSYCIPAMVLSVRACLAENPGVDLPKVREYLSGNLCRCGTYGAILEAVTHLLSQPGDDDRR